MMIIDQSAAKKQLINLNTTNSDINVFDELKGRYPNNDPSQDKRKTSQQILTLGMKTKKVRYELNKTKADDQPYVGYNKENKDKLIEFA